MKLSSYTGGFVQTNGYLIETPAGNVVIDAPAGITEWLDEKGVRVDHVLLTHQHYDHVEDAAALRERGAKLHAYAPYSTQLTLESAARSWGLPISVKPYEVDEKLVPDSTLELAGLSFQLEYVPGHSTDSVTLYLADAKTLFSGDTLFAGSIGRGDLPGGDMPLLLDGIAQKLMILPPMTRVYPGHGPPTTIAEEARNNPYIG